MRIAILVAEDEAPTRELMKILLQDWREDVRVEFADSPEAADAAANKNSFTIALVDLHYQTSARDGFSLLASLREKDPALELIVLSSADSFGAIQQAMRAGANDYLAKGFGKGELYHSLNRSLERRRWRKIEARVRKIDQDPLRAIAGRSPAWQSMLQSLRKFGPGRAPVLVFGETGTGKELAARALHALGDDPGAPFVAVNCAAVPASTADSFFFGHEKGSFTGADRMRAGVFEEADGGTLFLDEVNSLPAEMQGKLLRVLEQKEVRRLGGNRVVPVDFRLLAATNGDLEAMVKRGQFREDLLYRLNTLQIHLPPLRERTEDLEVLAQIFQPERTFAPELWPLWKSYAWPGNIRELRNLLTAMDAMAEPAETLRIEHIPEHLLRRFSAVPARLVDGPDDSGDTVEDFSQAQGQREAEFLARAYRSAKGNVSQMARVLGVDRSHLHQKLLKLGIHRAR